jgi:hypothetical protein
MPLPLGPQCQTDGQTHGQTHGFTEVGFNKYTETRSVHTVRSVLRDKEPKRTAINTYNNNKNNPQGHSWSSDFDYHLTRTSSFLFSPSVTRLRRPQSDYNVITSIAHRRKDPI